MSRQTGRWRLLLVTTILSLFVLTSCDSGSRGSGASQPGETPRSSDARPAAAAVPAPQRPVVAETLPYAEVDDELVYGHFVFPADMVDPLPGILVFHEWWGLDDGVRALADRVAAEGYVVLAVDLYGGRTTRSPAEAREMMVEVIEIPARATENIRQAYQFLVESGQAPRIGALGWDFGGGWALNTALQFPAELDATVIYYGQVSADERRLAPVDVPILGLFGGKDSGIPVENVRAFEQVLERLGKNYEIEIYPNAEHGFADATGRNYDAAVAEQAWARTLEFLDRHLSISTE